MGQEKKITLLRTKKATEEATITVAAKADLTVASALADLAATVGLGKDQKRIDRLVRLARKAAGKGKLWTTTYVLDEAQMKWNHFRPFTCCDESGLVDENGTPVAFYKGETTPTVIGKPWADRMGNITNSVGDRCPAPPWLIALHQDYGIHWQLSVTAFFFWRKLTLRWTP